jgi:glutaredoxin
MHSHNITLITIPVCPKRKLMKKRLQRIMELHPDVTLEEVGLQSYIGEAIKRRIMDAPIIIIGDKTFTGVVDDSTILSALGINAQAKINE